MVPRASLDEVQIESLGELSKPNSGEDVIPRGSLGPSQASEDTMSLLPSSSGRKKLDDKVLGTELLKTQGGRQEFPRCPSEFVQLELLLAPLEAAKVRWWSSWEIAAVEGSLLTRTSSGLQLPWGFKQLHDADQETILQARVEGNGLTRMHILTRVLLSTTIEKRPNTIF